MSTSDGEILSKQSETDVYWMAYLASLSEGSEPPSGTYEAWSFCDNEQDANELSHLVKVGTKTATCGLVWAYEAENEEFPKVGDLSIITNWAGEPICMIETTQVQVKPFNEVDELFAYDEGEGDRSLAYWRKVHWDAFSRECTVIGQEPAETMLLLCQRFRVVFPKQADR
jgi:uncharacterized protein YhfF